MPEIVPPEPTAPFSMDAILDEMWQGAQDSLVEFFVSPGFLAFAVIGAVFTVAVFVLKRVLVARSRKLMWEEWGRSAGWAADVDRVLGLYGLIQGRIDNYLEVTWRRAWMAFRRPRVHTACWYIAGMNIVHFMVLAEFSKDAEKFGSHLLPLAAKVVKDEVEDPLTTWRDLMRFADRSPEEHERLAAPGYTLAESIISVEQDIPLEYAAALARV